MESRRGLCLSWPPAAVRRGRVRCAPQSPTLRPARAGRPVPSGARRRRRRLSPPSPRDRAQPGVRRCPRASAQLRRLAHEAAVDQRVHCGGYIDILADDTDLLQEETGREEGLAMRLADLRVGEVGALDELLCRHLGLRSEEHTSELQSLMRISYAV